jgi:hypothetical protein
MLEKLLKLIREEGAIASSVLALRLGVSQVMVDAMLADLERAGYLRQVQSGSNCSQGACSGKTCQPETKIWIIGKRLL